MAEAAAGRARVLSPVGIGVILTGLAFGYAAGVVGPAATPVSRDFDVSLAAVGLLTSVFFVAIVVFDLFGAPIEERLGVAWSARLASALMVLGALVTAASPWFAGVLAGRAIAGIGTGIGLIAAPVIARALGSVFLLGLYGSGITVGIACSLVVGGQLADAGVSWRVGFVIAAATALVSLPFLAAKIPDVEHKQTGFRGMGELVARWRFWRPALLLTFVNGVPVVIGAWLLSYLTRHHGLGAGVAGALGFLLFGVTALSRGFAGRLEGARVLFGVLGPALGAVGLVAIAVNRSPALATVAVIAIGLGFGLPYAFAYESVEDLVAGAPELGLALGLVVANLAATLFTPLVGSALAHGYGRLSFLLLAAYCAAAGVANLTRRAG